MSGFVDNGQKWQLCLPGISSVLLPWAKNVLGDSEVANRDPLLARNLHHSQNMNDGVIRQQVETSRPKQWYVVYSKPHKEEQARFYLHSKNLDVFFPRLLLPGSASKKKRIVPLFPNYLFVRIHLMTEYHFVVWTPGVRRIVSFNDDPVPLDEEVVRFLMSQGDPAGLITARSNLRQGQEVEINSGLFAGLPGIIQRPPDNRGRVKVLLKLLSRQIKVDLPVQCINGGWVAHQPREGLSTGSNFFAG